MPLRANGQEQRHFFPDNIDKVYSQIRSKGYPVDWDRLHCTGYSAGGRGCMRQAVERPNVSRMLCFHAFALRLSFPTVAD